MKNTGTLKVTTPTDREIVLTRVFDAPRNLVFEAFTKPELLKRWYGPRGWSLATCEVDLKVGGGFRFVLRGPDGQEMGMRGVYREIVPPQRTMGQVNFGKRVSTAKGNAAPGDVEEYLAAVPEPARGTLNKVRAAIRAAVPPETTETISYRIPTFKYKGPLVGFAAFSNHCSLFPMSGSVVEAFKNELKGFETSKGTIRFPVDKPLPAALVKKLVKARIAEKEHKKQR